MTTITLTKENKDFIYLKSVVSAISKEDTRYFLNCIKVETIAYVDSEPKKRLIATDGRILCFFDTRDVDLEDGNYKVDISAKEITLTKGEFGVFPNYQRVIPDISVGSRMVFDNKAKDKKGGSPDFTKNYIELYDTTKKIIRLDHLKLLPKKEMDVYYSDKEDRVPVVFKVDNFTAVIAPFIL